MARYVWDDHSWHVLSDRHVRLARSVGALSELPVALNSRAFMLLFAGELAAAASLIQQLRPAIEATGSNRVPYSALGLAAFAGRQAEAATLIDAITGDVSLRGEGVGITIIEWASAVLNNGIGNYEAAVEAAQRSTEYLGEMITPPWSAVELIEAAARSGRTEMAADALTQLAVSTSASGTDWALGIEARSRALLSDGDTAERLYRESIDRLGRTHMRADLARAHLLYGEWLRRERRRIDARAQLRIAHDMLETMGMDAFAERARRELQATGETARKRASPPAMSSSRHRRPRSRGWLATACPIRRSASACSSAHAPSSTTCARSSPSSASSRAASSIVSCPTDQPTVVNRTVQWRMRTRPPSA